MIGRFHMLEFCVSQASRLHPSPILLITDIQPVQALVASGFLSNLSG
jgi:hypothetical protein